MIIDILMIIFIYTFVKKQNPTFAIFTKNPRHFVAFDREIMYNTPIPISERIFYDKRIH